MAFTFDLVQRHFSQNGSILFSPRASRSTSLKVVVVLLVVVVVSVVTFCKNSQITVETEVQMAHSAVLYKLLLLH